MDENVKEEIKKLIDQQKELFKEFVAELNGKNMNYESCRLLKIFLITILIILLEFLVQL